MNKISVMGRLTREPELRYTNTSEKAVVNFTLAVDRKHSNKNGEKVADFFNVVTWGKMAEFCNNYFDKGLKVIVSGRLQIRSWIDSDGKKRQTAEIVANEAYFAEGKRDANVRASSGEKKKETKKELLTAVS